MPINPRSCATKISIKGFKSSLVNSSLPGVESVLGGFLMAIPPQRGIKNALLLSGWPKVGTNVRLAPCHVKLA